MVTCSAPGKVILFGEHAVVYGKPAIAVAVDRRLYCTVEKNNSDITEVNGYPINETHHGYILEAMKALGVEETLSIKTSSHLQSGAGLGSSAAVTIAALGALHGFMGETPSEELIARQGFDIECGVQGSASPIDTSTSTHGGAVILSNRKIKNFLWHIEKEGTFWNIHEGFVPNLNIVVGYTGVHAATPPLVGKVSNFYNRNTFARDIVDEIGEVVEAGRSALERGDLVQVGNLMDRNHKLLKILGVSHPKLDSLVKVSRKYSYGAKLTGAGGGGSMIAITDDPDKVSEAISKRGGIPFTFEPAETGFRYEKSFKYTQ